MIAITPVKNTLRALNWMRKLMIAIKMRQINSAAGAVDIICAVVSFENPSSSKYNGSNRENAPSEYKPTVKPITMFT